MILILSFMQKMSIIRRIITPKLIKSIFFKS